ncbi:MAG: spore coat U domain-containing protein [Pseudomonadota bacterium]|nr:spore coat U domain-containing protein [Pseudomonadota bacterium]
MPMFTRAAVAAALLAAAPIVSAANATDTMSVSLTIQNACTITANPMDFGAQTTVTAAIDSATTVAVACSASGGPVAVTFGTGTGAGATFSTRKLTNAAATATIDYSLYIDTARNSPLGDGTAAGGAAFSATSTGSTQTFDVYGRVASGQGVKPVGTYTDTVVATVTF